MRRRAVLRRGELIEAEAIHGVPMRASRTWARLLPAAFGSKMRLFIFTRIYSTGQEVDVVGAVAVVVSGEVLGVVGLGKHAVAPAQRFVTRGAGAFRVEEVSGVLAVARGRV